MLADQLVGLLERGLGHAVADALAALQHEGMRAERLTLDDGEEHGALLVLDRLRAAARSTLTRGLHEDVDLAAAGQADLPRLLVGDAVGHEPGRARLEHLARALVDVGLHAPA